MGTKRSSSSANYNKKKRNKQVRFQPNYYPPNHAKRPELRQSRFEALRHVISAQFGLPSDCRIYFLKKYDVKNLPDTPRIRIKFGNSVILDADTWKVIQVNCFLPFAEMSPEKKNEMEFVIKNIYQHTLARSLVTVCASTKGIEDFGEMRSAGFRPGSDKGRTFGVTAFKGKTGRNEESICADQDCMLEMAAINEILAESLESLCLHAFQSNRKLAIKYSVPSFADPTWSESPNANVVGSSIVCTRDGFNNNPHRDNDATQYAYGLFARINRETGELHWVMKSDYLGDIEGCYFVLDEYHAEVALDSCDGVIESCWASNELHHTSESTAYDEGWNPIPHRDSPITRFGSSLQINKSLVTRIEGLLKLKENKSPDEWEEYKKKVVKCYLQEVDNRLHKIHDPKKSYQKKKSTR